MDQCACDSQTHYIHSIPHFHSCSVSLLSLSISTSISTNVQELSILGSLVIRMAHAQDYICSSHTSMNKKNKNQAAYPDRKQVWLNMFKEVLNHYTEIKSLGNNTKHTNIYNDTNCGRLLRTSPCCVEWCKMNVSHSYFKFEVSNLSLLMMLSFSDQVVW